MRLSYTKLISWITTLLAVAAAASAQTQQSSAQVARRLAENNQALKRYSWSMRVELTAGGEKKTGLYKMRYDVDGKLQGTPVSAGAPSPEDMQRGIKALGEFGMAYAQPGAYAFQRFLDHAEFWEGRGSRAGTLRIEGANLHVADDHVTITLEQGRPRRLDADTTFNKESTRIHADYRDLPNNGPAYVARMVIDYPNVRIQIENFEHASSAAGPVATVTLPQGTQIQVRSTQPLSTEHDQSGQTFGAIVETAVVVDGRDMVPKGTRAVGRLVEVERSGRASGRAKMSLALTSLYLPQGPLAIQTELLAFEAESNKKEDARRIGGATAIGALIGAAAGGGSGAGKGAVVGAGVGTTATLATRGDELEFDAEQLFVFRLAAPVGIDTR